MIYLDTKMCGYDEDKIGFPSVQTCMAIVAETADRLIGWHASSGAESFAGQAVTFVSYVARKRQGQPLIHVYGVTHGNRGSNSSLQEMHTVCGAMAYKGKGSFVVLAGNESDYVEVRRRGNGNRCGIYSSPTNNSSSYQKGDVDPNETRHRMIKPGVDRAAKLYGGVENTAPVVERFLLLERGNGLRWVELADVKPFEV